MHSDLSVLENEEGYKDSTNQLWENSLPLGSITAKWFNV